MDRKALQRYFELLDKSLESDTLLLIRGGAAVLALGLKGRTTVDIDVLPDSLFVESDLAAACEKAGLAFNPVDKDGQETDYIEVVPEETLVLPHPSGDRPYDTVFRGRRLTVRTPPAADIIVGKLKRLDPEDLADVSFLVNRFGLTRVDIEEAMSRLPGRFRDDPVVNDNLRYIIEDFL